MLRIVSNLDVVGSAGSEACTDFHQMKMRLMVNDLLGMGVGYNLFRGLGFVCYIGLYRLTTTRTFVNLFQSSVRLSRTVVSVR